MNKFKVGDIVVVTSKDSLLPFDTSFKVAEISVQGSTTYYRKQVGVLTGVEEESLELLYRPHGLIRVDTAYDSLTSCGTPYVDSVITTPGSITSAGLGWTGEYRGIESYETKTNKQITIMDKITTFAKNLTLSAEEKALRKVGLKTECGDYTQEAQMIIMQTLCKEREASLVEIANKMIEEDKDTK